MQYTSCCRTLLDMGVFDALPIDGMGMSAAALAEKLQADEELISKLLNLDSRNVQVTYLFLPILFEEPCPETYAPSLNTRMYLSPSLRGMFKTRFVHFKIDLYLSTNF